MIFICFVNGKNVVTLTDGQRKQGKKRNKHSLEAGRPPTIISFLDLMKVLHGKAGISVYAEHKTRLHYLEKTIWHFLLPEIIK